jgi:hypothetical protein
MYRQIFQGPQSQINIYMKGYTAGQGDKWTPGADPGIFSRGDEIGEAESIFNQYILKVWECSQSLRYYQTQTFHCELGVSQGKPKVLKYDGGTRFLTPSESMDISDGKVLFVPNEECTCMDTFLCGFVLGCQEMTPSQNKIPSLSITCTSKLRRHLGAGSFYNSWVYFFFFK